MPDHERYRKSDQLDDYLQFAFRNIKFKYRWRRLEVFRQFLEEHYGMSQIELESLIKSLKVIGPSVNQYDKWSFDDIPQWYSQWCKNRGTKAANVRWSKRKSKK
jgi:hypothetical protein